MGDTVIVETPADEVVSIVTQGPQGPSGSEAVTLTTTGDLLYRDALANDRLPIGSEGQVLKVSSGLPAWGNESGAVTSVNGETGTVVLDAADVGAATSAQGSLADSAMQPGDAPTAHASSHFSAGLDPISANDIGAQSLLVSETLTITADTQLTISNRRYSILNFSGAVRAINLPTTGHKVGDVIQIRCIAAFGLQITSDGVAYGGNPNILPGGQQTFIATGTAANAWSIERINDHSADSITSGTLAHERGGLEADVSAYNGLLKIASGSTSAVTVTAAGEALLDDADAAAQRTTLGLGNSATLDTGTTAGTVAEGDHTHADLHTRSHAITSTSDHTAGNHKVFYSDGSGQIQELALGNSGEVLTSNGATSAPSFAAASGGGATLMQSIAVGFVLN